MDMFKKTILLLSILILFCGCENNKKKTENSVYNKKEHFEYTINKISGKIIGNTYIASYKTLHDPDIYELKSLVNVFSQDELSELIEEIDINFYALGIEEPDLMFLEYFPQLKRLKIGGESIENANIEGLKYLQNLEELHISHMNVSDISPIANLDSLKFLRLYGLLEIRDLSPIENLISLETLYLWDLISINDISAISNLKCLKYLDITNIMSSYYTWDSIENFNPIFELINLEHLEVGLDRKGNDIKNIVKLKNLEYLYISIYNQAELNIISDLPQLKELQIRSGNFNDVTPLLKLNKLENIDFNWGSFYDIMPLAASKSLKYIRMDFGPEKWGEFLNNGDELFEKNDIGVYPYDWR
jgi:Leucine-rich repeat (LRR) protein